MPGIFEHHHTIGADEIDGQGHANNVRFVSWMQDAALAHTAAEGWPADRYRELGLGWVARSHTIEYHASALAGEEIVVRTWVATMQKVTSVRRYRIVRRRDGALLATAETRWAFVDFNTGQPARIPAELARAFHLIDQSAK